MTYLLIGLGILLVLGVFVVSNYNSLITLRNKVRDEWAQIDVQLKRRSDLIPNLVETVKGIVKHEEKTFLEVIEARNSFNASSTKEEKIKENEKMEKAVTKLLALGEAYPELKSNSNFESLQKELKETEDKISYARSFYNDIVLKYANKIDKFPSNVIASLFKFEKEPFFEAKETEKENVEIKF